MLRISQKMSVVHFVATSSQSENQFQVLARTLVLKPMELEFDPWSSHHHISCIAFNNQSVLLANFKLLKGNLGIFLYFINESSV